MFKVGDMAVYPAQGVGRIDAIEEKDLAGERHEFYVLRLIDSDMTIMVPVSNAKGVGLRSLIEPSRIPELMAILENRQDLAALSSWSRRQREYTDKLKTGCLFEVVAVLRELYTIKENKDLSYGEKKVLELAQKLLITEVSLAEGVEAEQVSERMKKALS